MRDCIDIGSAPAEEDCAQVGAADYAAKARGECVRFIELIRKQLGTEPEDAQLSIKSNPHDFGTYYSVVCRYEDTTEQAVRYAFRCEDEAPTRWEDEAAIPAAQTVKDRLAAAPCDSCKSVAYDNGMGDMAEMVMVAATDLSSARQAPTLAVRHRSSPRTSSYSERSRSAQSSAENSSS